MRIRFIRFLAVCFMILGIWDLFRIFEDMNLAYAVTAFFLFRAGDNMFSLKETGRKLAIFVLGIDVLRCIIIILLALSNEDFGFGWIGLGASFESDSKFLFAAVLITWISIEVLLGLFLLQEKTRLIFQSKQAGLSGEKAARTGSNP